MTKELFLVSSILWATAANATYIGWAPLSAMADSFPCDQWLEAMEGVDKPAMAVVWGTFGTNKSCMRRFLSKNKHQSHLLEIHISNQTCYETEKQNTKKKCGIGELMTGINQDEFNQRMVSSGPKSQELHNKIIKRVRRIKKFINNNSNANTEVILSTGLEDNFTRKAYKKMVKLIRNAGWQNKIARNPEGRKYQMFGDVDYLELHPGEKISLDWQEKDGRRPAFPTNCIVNFDGVSVPEDVSLMEAKQFIRNNIECTAVFLWQVKAQGGGTGSNLPPRERTFTISDKTKRELRCVMTTWAGSNTCGN